MTFKKYYVERFVFDDDFCKKFKNYKMMLKEMMILKMQKKIRLMKVSIILEMSYILVVHVIH